MIRKFACLSLMSVLGLGSALAVPARPLPVEVEQPDGSKVTLTLRGDEYFHYYQTSDGYIVKDMADGWYRVVDSNGEPTALAALDVADRTAAYKSDLSAINSASAFEKLREKTEAASVRRTQYREDRLSVKRAGTRSKAMSYEPKWDNADGHFLREFPAEGNQKVLIILVSYADKDWSFCPDPHAEMQKMLQEPGYSNYECTGSAFDYFFESSRGMFRPSFDVYGPVKLPKNMSYYGGNDRSGNDQHPEEMVIDACNILDAEIDFSEYDRDGDGVVDNIYVFYAGYGENEGASSNTVWPHSWDIRYAGAGNVSHDGVLIGHYACSNEMIYGSNKMTGIGTFCHEFSHVLGLPDLYATSYTGAHTPGEYSLMDHGSYNNNGRTPPIYSGYERYALEWQAPYVISKEETIRMRGLTDQGNFYKMTVNSSKPTEYFLFENRQPIGNDWTLPASGMLIWHIDYRADKWANNTVNNTPSDQCVDIVEADGSASDYDMSGDTFPGETGNTEFSATSRPAFANKNGEKSKLGLYDIAESSDGLISFRVGDGMNENSDYICEAPYAEIESLAPCSVTLKFKGDNGASFDKGAGGEILVVSVESMGYDEDEDLFTNIPLDGYVLKKVASNTTLTIPGLKPQSVYRVKVYREGADNISDPYELSVLTGGETVAETAPVVSVRDVKGNDATLSWTPVDGADHYLVTVATRDLKPSSESVSCNFTSSSLPAGWTCVGVFNSQVGNVGEAAPSLYLSYDDDYLRTAIYDDKEIESVSLWTRKASDKPVALSLYSQTEGGSLSYIADLPVSTTGQIASLDDLPENVHGLVFLLKNPDGTRVYLDDIKILFRGEYTDTPVGLYSDMPVNDNNMNVTGLEKVTPYVAYVKVHDGEKDGVRSNTVSFITTDQSGVETIGASDLPGFYIAGGILYCTDSATAFDVVALDGTIVALDVKGKSSLPSRGVYIIRTKQQTLKVIY